MPQMQTELCGKLTPLASRTITARCFRCVYSWLTTILGRNCHHCLGALKWLVVCIAYPPSIVYVCI